MLPNISSKQSGSGHGPYRLLLSVGLPFLLLLAFLSQQVFNFDNIGWSHGFSHPLIGWDHLVTMLAVGVWAAQLRGQAVWMLPLAFVGVMSLGGLAGAAGISIPSVEGIILLSCAVFSVLITRKIRFSAKINVMIVAFFAFFHGFAHGQEISASASLISYTLGFMLATLLLHGAGILVAKLVVLTVTCLLAAIFSSSALAKYSSTQQQNNPVFATKILFDANGSFGCLGKRITEQRLFPADSVSRQNHLKSFPLDSSGTAISASFGVSHQTSAANLRSLVDYFALTFKTDTTTVLSDLWSFSLLSDEYCEPCDLSFKKHYPAINHTPGTHLLSNGVGLTSPPVANQVVYAQSAVPSFRKNTQSAFEDNHLQLIFANFDSGKIPHIVSKDHTLFGRFDASVVVSDIQKSGALGQNSVVSNLFSNDPEFSTGSAIDQAVASIPNSVLTFSNLPVTNKLEGAFQTFAFVLNEIQVEIPLALSANTSILIKTIQ